ncbi:hypothetical protein AAG570_011619 [Ranatra chinensis]|uniref:CCDC144C-like coiled-coil domain-containing protein n=1 Tax=Ranatra chinensis TaxID=642074 RepID=A0ABD0YLD5_9HEMI
MLNETIHKLREELNKAVVERGELSARASYNEEKCKTLQANCKTLISRVEALENQCKNYRATIGRHEESLQHLRDEAMTAMSNLSVCEVTVANLKQENQLLRDSERRLINERDAERKQKRGQEMLMANLEALKAKFECSNAEARMKLEGRLDDATKECTALRRRLQEEQDRLTRRMELSEQQTATAKERLEEEKTLRIRLNEEVEAARELVKQRENQIESMSNQLSSAISNSQPVVERGSIFSH